MHDPPSPGCCTYGRAEPTGNLVVLSAGFVDAGFGAVVDAPLPVGLVAADVAASWLLAGCLHGWPTAPRRSSPSCW